jgi:hypothetical protein
VGVSGSTGIGVLVGCGVAVGAKVGGPDGLREEVGEGKTLVRVGVGELVNVAVGVKVGVGVSVGMY